MTVIGSALTLYNWVVVAILLVFQFLIARFYEKKSSQRSYYTVFLVPALLFLLAAGRYAFWIGDLAGDLWGDSLLFVGGWDPGCSQCLAIPAHDGRQALKIVIGLSGSLGLLAVIYTLFVLAAFSQRMGEVLKRPPLYRGFYVGAACLTVAVIVRFLRVSVLLASAEGSAFLQDDRFYLLAYHAPLALGLTVSLVVTWRYWSWLLRERV